MLYQRADIIFGLYITIHKRERPEYIFKRILMPGLNILAILCLVTYNDLY